MAESRARATRSDGDARGRTTGSGNRTTGADDRAADAGRRTSGTGRKASETAGKTSARHGPSIDARSAAALAAAHVSDLTGRDPEGVTALERLDGGWRVAIEVLESHRIPDSTDLLAVYSVELDADGELVGYRREERYHRGRTQERT